jgi:IS30 family transposase
MTPSRHLRHRLSPPQVAQLWAAWKQGQSLTAIATTLGGSVSSIRGVVARQGGISPRPRTRSARVLSLKEREEISRGLAANQSVRDIARTIGRAPSTVSREIRRHGTPASYRATEADQDAWQRARRPKPCRLATNHRLRGLVATKLAASWSPQQIAGWLVTQYPDAPELHLSHETIYRSLYVQARGVLKKELLRHLRRQRTMRRAQQSSRAKQGRGQIVDAVSISERPPSVEDRALPGHWEGDLLAGAKNSHIATLVERHSRYVHLVKVTGKDTTSVLEGLYREVHKLPGGLVRSLTWDRGTEMGHHQVFSVATDIAIYFCDPHSPWQRGSNENTNGLLRQFLPHGTDLRPYTQRQLNTIAKKLNTRPRQTLGFRTPAEVLTATVASTG